MTIPPGRRLGPYEIVSALGAGGMGEVYRAKDTRLDRSVAIKVLPDQSAGSDGLRERFEREARVISSLNHPHICVLHDVGHQDGTDYLVMELCEGETLAARLAKGPLPLNRALQYSIEISDALDKAHRMGVTHRDLKPGNVMATKSGIKLLDFGLAKLRQETPSSGFHLGGQTDSDQTTTGATADPITAQGMILGTLQYMAPEQLEGKEVDARADIFSFGAMMFEMATGKKAFEGNSQASVAAAILTQEPPSLSSLQVIAPPAFERAVKTCLAKDPDERWQTAGDLRRELKWIAESSSQASSTMALPATSATSGATEALYRREWPLWGVAALFAAIAAVLAVVHFTEKPASGPPPVRLDVRLPDKVAFVRTATLVLSPDGQHVAFPAVGPDGRSHIWIQDLSGAARALSETDTSSEPPPPFWSPDSRFIVFSGTTKVRKANIQTGAVQDICDKPGPVIGGSWNREDVIIFGSPTRGLWKGPGAGGACVPLTDLSLHEREHEMPTFLPDGRHFLYLRVSETPADSGIYVGSLDDAPDRQSRKRILATGFGAAFVPLHGNIGRLLFFHDGELRSQEFDAQNFQLRGDVLPVAEGVGSAFETPLFSAAPNVLIFKEPATASRYQLTWFDDKGNPAGKVGDPADGFFNRQISPDGTRVVFSRLQTNQAARDLWVLDLARGTTMRFTFATGSNDYPVWSPDGREIVFSSNRNGKFDLYRKPADGSRPEELVLKSNEDKEASSWSRDGKFLAYESGRLINDDRIWILPLAAGAKPISISAGSNFDTAFPQFSPDGRRITYISNETGRYEAYVQELTISADSVTAGSKLIVSKGGALYPVWRSDGKQIVYVDNARGALFAVPFDPARFQVGAPTLLFQLPTERGATNIPGGTADLKRFLIPVAQASEIPQKLTVIVNWMSTLKRE